MRTDFIAVDLTSHSPHWLDADGESGPIHPVFCLPVHAGEPPLTGDAARVHRRGTLSQEHPSESYLNPMNRSRWHLAEGWISLARNPDSLQPAITEFGWTPPGEERRRSVSFEEVLVDVLTPFVSKTSTLGLVIPDRLGPGPQQQVLDHLRSLFDKVHLIPRPIAIALDWLDGNAHTVSAEALSRGDRAGELLVTSASADYWEVAIVPLRVENRKGIKTMCPVHDRTRPQGDWSRVGLVWDMACRPGDSEFDRLRQLLTNPTQPAIGFRMRQTYEQCLDPDLIPAAIYATEEESVREESVRIVLEEVKNAIAFVPLAWLYAGSLEAGKAPQWIQSLRPCGTPVVLPSPERSAVRGARRDLALLQSGMPPFYAALSPLKL